MSWYSRKKRIQLVCENSKCKKTFERINAELSINNFCSRSCSAQASNSLRKKKIKICSNNNCNKAFTGNKKYCSFNCIPLATSKYTNSIILKKIQNFVEEKDRIPTKRDMMNIYARARKTFGTWNNAIKEAGFDPNPVLFAKKHIAKDGHKCDSLSEKIIDDFLYRKHIKHERNIPYQENNMTADFKINDIFIEFLGLQGVLESYDNLLIEKEKLWKERGLNVIKIYPNDLFPKNKLDQIFNFIVNKQLC